MVRLPSQACISHLLRSTPVLSLHITAALNPSSHLEHINHQAPILRQVATNPPEAGCLLKGRPATDPLTPQAPEATTLIDQP